MAFLRVFDCPTEAQAYQKRIQRARQKKEPQVKPCRLQQQRERFQRFPSQAYKKQRSILSRAIVRMETNVFIHTVDENLPLI